MQRDDFDRELERRLAIVEDTEYHDPATADLPARDLILLLIGSLGVIVAMLAWGYPW